ncbi:hypothetical protein [Lutispora thermophila]|uniref:hypothetical protein n=1 Tax=Lutispora thermophila TaxID=288966 RepID=UPI00158722A4|nr:hypothetical protein [Lutispora thermophila]
MLLSNVENTDMLLDKSAFFLDEQIRKAILLLNPQIEKASGVVNQSLNYSD